MNTWALPICSTIVGYSLMITNDIRYVKNTVIPEAGPRTFCGNSSAIIENGIVRNPSVLVKMYVMIRKVGIQLRLSDGGE